MHIFYRLEVSFETADMNIQWQKIFLFLAVKLCLLDTVFLTDVGEFDDLAVLGRCLRKIRNCMEEETAVAFENGLLNCGNPDDLINDAVKVLQDATR